MTEILPSLLVEGSNYLGITLLVCVYQSVNSSWKSMLGGLAKFIRSFKSHLTDLSELIQVILTASCLGRFEGHVR